MTILLVIPSLTTGGAEAFVVRLANELSQRHAVHLYLFDEQASLSLRDRLAPTVQLHGRSPRLRLWVDRIRLRLRRLGIRFWTADDVTKYCLRKLCKELHPAVVNTHLYLANAFVAETIDDLGCPQVVTDHGDYRYLSTTGAVTTDELRQSLRGARAIVALCDANMPLLERLAPESTIRKIYNGLEPSALRPIDADRARLDLPDDAIVFGMVARGIPEKGWNEAVEAFEQIDRRVRRACLVLVGESPTLRDLAANYTHDPDIKFVGWAADPLPWIAAIDVGVLPTYYVGETLPNFVMECQAQGKPVIATDVAGIREMLTVDGALCGELIPLANDGRADVASLAQAMNSYLHDSARRMADGELAKRGALRFDIRATAAAYERLFEEITLPPGQAHARLAEAIAVDVAAAG